MLRLLLVSDLGTASSSPARLTVVPTDCVSQEPRLCIDTHRDKYCDEKQGQSLRGIENGLKHILRVVEVRLHARWGRRCPWIFGAAHCRVSSGQVQGKKSLESHLIYRGRGKKASKMAAGCRPR